MTTLLRRLLRPAKPIARTVRDRLFPPERQLLFACMGGSGAWPEMGRESYAASAVFRESIDASARVVEEILEWDPVEFFRGIPEPQHARELTQRNAIVHLGMVQLAQIDLWREAGVDPPGVVSVSLGEMVAPYAARALSRDDSMRVVAAMAHAVSRGTVEGRLFLLDADAITGRKLCRLAPAPLDYLGNTSPRMQVTLARESDADALRAYLGAAVAREIPTPWTYHTPRHDMDVRWFHDVLAGIEPRPAACRVYSSATGGRLPKDFRFDARFFAWMARSSFHFADAVNAALADGFDAIISIGAHASMNRELAATATARKQHVLLFDSMRVDQERAVFESSRAAVTRLRLRQPKPRAVPPAATLELHAVENPFEAYEKLRRGGDVHYLRQHDSWIVLDYAGVQRALGDAKNFSSRTEVMQRFDPVLIGQDPPEHTNMRRIVARLFTPELTARRGERAARVCEELLEPLARGEQFDVVGQLCNPLIEIIAAELIGFDRDAVETFVDATLTHPGNAATLADALTTAIHAAAPRTPLYHELLRDGLDERGAASIIRLLWVASTTTTKRLIPSAILLLLEKPDVRAALDRDPQLLDAFMEEVLRLRPPEHTVERRTTSAVDLGGVRIPAGSLVYLCLAAANRDPKRFPDPHELRLDRGPNPHLSFAAGAHRCIGAGLARAETIAALRALLRIPFFAVQPPDTVRYATAAYLRAPEQLVIAS